MMVGSTIIITIFVCYLAYQVESKAPGISFDPSEFEDSEPPGDGPSSPGSSNVDLANIPLSIKLASGIELTQKNGQWSSDSGQIYKPVPKPTLTTEPGQDAPTISWTIDWQPASSSDSEGADEQIVNSLLVQNLEKNPDSDSETETEQNEPSPPSGDFEIPKDPEIPLPPMDEEDEPAETTETSADAPITAPNIPLPPIDKDYAVRGSDEYEDDTEDETTTEAPGTTTTEKYWWLKSTTTRPRTAPTTTRNLWWTTTRTPARDVARPTATTRNIWWTTTRAPKAHAPARNTWRTATTARTVTARTLPPQPPGVTPFRYWIKVQGNHVLIPNRYWVKVNQNSPSKTTSTLRPGTRIALSPTQNWRVSVRRPINQRRPAAPRRTASRAPSPRNMRKFVVVPRNQQYKRRRLTGTRRRTNLTRRRTQPSVATNQVPLRRTRTPAVRQVKRQVRRQVRQPTRAVRRMWRH